MELGVSTLSSKVLFDFFADTQSSKDERAYGRASTVIKPLKKTGGAEPATNRTKFMDIGADQMPLLGNLGVLSRVRSSLQRHATSSVYQRNRDPRSSRMYLCLWSG